MRKKTRVVLVVTALAATAGPAFANSVTVNASPTASSRQLKVLDMAGQPLSSVSLSRGQGQPFQVQVVDSGFSNLTNTNGFSVTAQMNNLYRVTSSSGVTPVTYDYNTAIPSSDVSIDYQTNPIRAFSPVASVLGNVSLSGQLPTCSLAGGISGLSGLLGSILTNAGLSLETTLCNELGSSALQVTNAGPVPLQSLTNLNLSSLLPSDLPFNLGSLLGTDYDKGAFTNADYSAGTIGAGDSAKPSSWATAVTARKLLTGKAGLTANLTSTITSALQSAINGLPLTSSTGSGAVLPVATAISAINSAGGSLSTLAGTLTQIASTDAADVVTLLNTLAPSIATPALSDLTNIGQTSVSLPIITYSGATTVPTGNYQGNMTVTLISQ